MAAYRKGQPRLKPNYFVAVQISNPTVHQNLMRVQHHILQQNKSLDICMKEISTMHITLMVMNISDKDTHERALKALQNVYDEYNEVMCKEPLQLEFSGLGNFNDQVLFAKIKRDEQYRRLRALEERVKYHFAKVQIFSTDSRPFNPHLTIAHLTFPIRKQIGLEKIEPYVYASFSKKYIGFQTITGIQLLCMSDSRDEAGYYIGDSLIFRSPVSQEESQLKRGNVAP